MAAITWTGTKGWYKSTDDRFTIMKGEGRGSWILFDKARVDPCHPEHTWNQYCCTLAAAKRYAAMAVRDHPPEKHP